MKGLLNLSCKAKASYALPIALKWNIDYRIKPIFKSSKRMQIFDTGEKFESNLSSIF